MEKSILWEDKRVLEKGKTRKYIWLYVHKPNIWILKKEGVK